MGIAAIGPVMQIAFVPRDFDAALQYWTTVMGVGPFFLLERYRLQEMTYRGAPSDCVFTLALAYWGDLQIELIRQDNDAASIYRGVEGEALHHTCILTADLVAAKATALAAGADILVEARVGEDGGVIYIDTHGGPGSIVEILQPATGSEALFGIIKSASVGWDGSDPIRRLG